MAAFDGMAIAYRKIGARIKIIRLGRFGELLNAQQMGFSLIELLIVVAIILIIAAIAIPNLLRSRMAANEASAVGSRRPINTAEITYASTYPAIGFNNLANLGGAAGSATTSTNATLLDAVLSSGTKSGYSFAVALTTVTSGNPNPFYSSTAKPVSVGQTGTRYFYSDASGVIRYNTTTSANSTDLPLQ